jgi:probable HAF family extracellular repeat protein
VTLAHSGLQPLATLGGQSSSALAINKSGQITGFAALNETGVSHAVLWSTPTQIQDLGTLGGTYSVGASINSSGVVVGYSTIQ